MMTKFTKVLAIVVVLCATALSSLAERPKGAQKSPWHYLQQMIGKSLVEIEYSRPGVKGREVWGKLVPYGEVWRAGANERTVISFEHDILINGEALSAGDYALFILPEQDQWIFIFNRAFIGHGSDGYDAKSDVLRVAAKPETAEHEEWMQFGVTDFEENAATVYLHFEKIRCGFRVELAK
ncbi:MAG: DUF2911 domain-containing protein [Candidatus Hydrogenedentota bacterium]